MLHGNVTKWLLWLKYLKYQGKSCILDQAFSFSSVTGQIRTVIGQAQLLIDQRFHQFSGLIDLSEVSLLVYTPSFALYQNKVPLLFNSHDLIVILPSSCYTFPCKLVMRIWSSIKVETLTWLVWVFLLPVFWIMCGFYREKLHVKLFWELKG